MRNDLPVSSVGRQPRGAVKVGGSVVPGWIEFEVTSNATYSADQFSVSFAISALPVDFGPQFWSEQKELEVELFAGFPDDPEHFGPSDLQSLIVGRVDEIGFDPVARTIQVHGRDFTSLLIDAKTTEKFPNQSASRIAETLAKRHGLTPVVTSTEGLAGTYYQIDHVTLSTERTEWDLLNYLAHEVGFVAYVKGRELHFEPKPDDGTADPFVLKWEAPTEERGYPVFNGTRLSFSRHLTVSKGVIVQVRSWNAKSKAGFTATYPKHGKGIQPGNATTKGDAQLYSYTIPNLTQQQADERAQKLYREIIAHEMRLDAQMPGDVSLTIADRVQVTGTGTNWDQDYYPESITRRMSMGEGFTMSLAAKNHDPNSTVL